MFLVSIEYRISSIRWCSYYLFCFVRLVFEGGVYFFGKPGDINNGWIRYVRVRRWRLLNTVSSTYSLSGLLSAVEMTCTTQTVIALVWWPSSEIICTRVCVPRLLYSHDYYSRAASIRRNTHTEMIASSISSRHIGKQQCQANNSVWQVTRLLAIGLVPRPFPDFISQLWRKLRLGVAWERG